MLLQILTGIAGILFVVGFACISTLLSEESKSTGKGHKVFSGVRKN